MAIFAIFNKENNFCGSVKESTHVTYKQANGRIIPPMVILSKMLASAGEGAKVVPISKIVSTSVNAGTCWINGCGDTYNSRQEWYDNYGNLILTQEPKDDGGSCICGEQGVTHEAYKKSRQG